MQSRLATGICGVDVVLAPVLDQPERDCGLVREDRAHQGRPPANAPPLLQHRRIGQYALLHRLQVAALKVVEDRVLLLLLLGHGAGRAAGSPPVRGGVSERTGGWLRTWSCMLTKAEGARDTP